MSGSKHIYSLPSNGTAIKKNHTLSTKVLINKLYIYHLMVKATGQQPCSWQLSVQDFWQDH